MRVYMVANNHRRCHSSATMRNVSNTRCAHTVVGMRRTLRAYCAIAMMRAMLGALVEQCATWDKPTCAPQLRACNQTSRRTIRSHTLWARCRCMRSGSTGNFPRTSKTLTGRRKEKTAQCCVHDLSGAESPRLSLLDRSNGRENSGLQFAQEKNWPRRSSSHCHKNLVNNQQPRQNSCRRVRCTLAALSPSCSLKLD